MLLSVLGGAAGAALLLMTGDAAFRRLVPWLLLVATLIFAFGPLILRAAKAKPASAAQTWPTVFAVAVYGGYFNGGLGILLLAAFGLLGQTRLNAMNGMKNLVSAVLTAIAVAVYAWGGVVAWPQALAMMLAATAGGYAGARIARRVPPALLRAAIVGVGLVMTALFFRF